MGRRVRATEAGTVRILESQVDRCLIAGLARRVRTRAAEVVDAQCVALTRRDGLEADDDAFRLARIDRKDARAEHAHAHPFDERRIPLATDDLLVHAACLI